jgi:FtsP/CotA-like multicopper oxidase with cupredoxin domain
VRPSSATYACLPHSVQRPSRRRWRWCSTMPEQSASLNGKSFPATEPITLKVGESIIVGYLHEGLMTYSMHLHQSVG